MLEPKPKLKIRPNPDHKPDPRWLQVQPHRGSRALGVWIGRRLLKGWVDYTEHSIAILEAPDSPDDVAKQTADHMRLYGKYGWQSDYGWFVSVPTGNQQRVVAMQKWLEHHNAASFLDALPGEASKLQDFQDLECGEALRGDSVVTGIADMLYYLHKSDTEGQSNLNTWLKAIITVCCDVNTTDQAGRTPLYVAARDGAPLESVRALVDAGANMDQSQDDGVTPLYVAAQVGGPPPKSIT